MKPPLTFGHPAAAPTMSLVFLAVLAKGSKLLQVWGDLERLFCPKPQEAAHRSSDRMQAGEGEPCMLVQPVHDVEALHGLSSCSLHQVINRTDHYHPVRARINFKADIAKVRPAQKFRLRVPVDAAAFLDDADEGLIRVVFAIYPQISFSSCG